MHRLTGVESMTAIAGVADKRDTSQRPVKTGAVIPVGTPRVSDGPRANTDRAFEPAESSRTPDLKNPSALGPKQ